MSPRPRQIGNKDLPPHVEVNTKDGTKYYRYVMPDGSRHSLGKDKAAAIAAALTLNAELARNPDILAKILRKKNEADAVAERASPIPPVSAAIDLFETNWLKRKTYADSTRENHGYMLTEYRQRWGDLRVNKLTLQDVSVLLNEKPAHSYVKHRILLTDLWAYWVAQGWCTDNLPAKTMEAILPTKQRQRHNIESLAAIRAISPDYLQRAIDLALHSLQRRADLVKLHRKAINIPHNTMTVLQEKSRNYDKPVYIEIDMHPELYQAVLACISSPLAFQCPYLLHYKPKRMTKQARDAKLHHLAMTDDFVTKEFAKYRDIAGVYNHLSKEEKPSFHDIRALGIKLITDTYGKEYAMALAGHADERMWEHYIDGHEELKPKKISFRK